jgi:5-methylcytosine-specific restriction endonuclease McrA
MGSGETGGYLNHRRAGEEPCGACRDVWNEYRRKYRKRSVRARKTLRDCEGCGRGFLSERGRFCSFACRDYGSRCDLVPVGPALYSDLPSKHPARQPSMLRGPRTFVEGPCAWCGDRFTIVDQLQARYCSARCGRAAGKAGRRRFNVSPLVRREVYERDGWVCQLCKDPVDPGLPTSDAWAATLDHIIPQAWVLVPDHRPENLRLTHRWCNSVRGDESHYDESWFEVSNESAA